MARISGARSFCHSTSTSIVIAFPSHRRLCAKVGLIVLLQVLICGIFLSRTDGVCLRADRPEGWGKGEGGMTSKQRHRGDPETKNPAAPQGPVDSRILAALKRATPTESLIGQHMQANLGTLSYETAASLAKKLGVGEASVGRFCRVLGYRHFRELKAALRDELDRKTQDRAFLLGDRLKALHQQMQSGPAARNIGMEREIAAVMRNYEIARSPEFARVAHRLSHCAEVFITGFQPEEGHAVYMARLLQYLRPRVRLVDSRSGHFSDVLLDAPDNSCILIMDMRRYSRLTRELAERARAAGLTVILLTDQHCDWGRDSVDDVLEVATDLNQFMDSSSGFVSLSSLLINEVFNLLGPQVVDRMKQMSEIYAETIGHIHPDHDETGERRR
ncbi:MurR/RpiR family transcriptional regulator [Paracoccus sp. NGMCC 1.201697]|uniref:MurR/RpiR family transcriptional regulator n=1 Tax=Paracoccus broussonetiae subsp. drimophilus TaxID=3373869 RepID=A0ABW7LJS1_9RHOB